MFRTITAFIILLFALSAVSAQSMQDKAKDAADKAVDAVRRTAEEDPKMTVRGRVFYEGSGLPLRRSWIGFVRIKPVVPVDPLKDEEEVVSPWDFMNPQSVLTNDFGEFVIKDVSPGIYQAVVKVPGILNPAVADKENTAFQQFMFEGFGEAQVEVGVRRGAAVSGYVRYPDGAPFIGGVVRLMKITTDEAAQTDKENEYESANTDDRGYYRFAGVPNGEYMILVMQPSVFDGTNPSVSAYDTSSYSAISELKTYFPSAAVREQASVLQLIPGQETTNIDVMLAQRELYEVGGMVVGDDDAKLIENINIEFRKIENGKVVSNDNSEIRTTTTDKAGRWKFKDMAPGEYVAVISETYLRRYYETERAKQQRENYATSEHKFVVAANETEDIVFRVAKEGRLAGVVTTEGNQALPESVSVNADTESKRAASESPETTDYDSEPYQQFSKVDFELEDLSEGKFFISVEASEGYYAKSITYGGKDVMDSPIEIKAGEHLKNLKIVLGTGSGTLKLKLTGFKVRDYTSVMFIPVRKDISLFRAYLRGETLYAGRSREIEKKLKPGSYYVVIDDDSIDQSESEPDVEKLNAKVKELLKNSIKIEVFKGRTIEAELRKADKLESAEESSNRTELRKPE